MTGGYDWDFSFLWPYAKTFARALGLTVELSVGCTVVGTIVGFPIGAMLRVRPLSWVLLPLNDVGRAIPTLVLLLFAFYFPYRDLLHVRPPSPFVSALLALSFAQAVFVADVVRGALNSVPNGLLRGGRALGMREYSVWRYLTMPYVVRTTLPTFVAFFIGNIKFTSLASVIACQEVVYVASVAAAPRSRYLEAWTVVAAIYVLLVVPLSFLGRRLERASWLEYRA